jgi:hypothetical protein
MDGSAGEEDRMTETLPRVCDYHGRDNEPCYGEIDELITGEGLFIAFCEGHQAVMSGGAYVPRDPVRRIIFSQQNKRIRELEAENATLWAAVKFADKKLLAMEPQEIEIPAERLEVLE